MVPYACVWWDRVLTIYAKKYWASIQFAWKSDSQFAIPLLSGLLVLMHTYLYVITYWDFYIFPHTWIGLFPSNCWYVSFWCKWAIIFGAIWKKKKKMAQMVYSLAHIASTYLVIDYIMFYFLANLFWACYFEHEISIAITKTCLHNFDPLKTHFDTVKLVFTRIYIIVLISAQKHRLMRF